MCGVLLLLSDEVVFRSCREFACQFRLPSSAFSWGPSFHHFIVVMITVLCFCLCLYLALVRLHLLPRSIHQSKWWVAHGITASECCYHLLEQAKKARVGPQSIMPWITFDNHTPVVTGWCLPAKSLVLHLTYLLLLSWRCHADGCKNW